MERIHENAFYNYLPNVSNIQPSRMRLKHLNRLNKPLKNCIKNSKIHPPLLLCDDLKSRLKIYKQFDVDIQFESLPCYRLITTTTCHCLLHSEFMEIWITKQSLPQLELMNELKMVIVLLFLFTLVLTELYRHRQM